MSLATEVKVTVVSRDLSDKQVQDWPADCYAGTWVMVQKSGAGIHTHDQIYLQVGDVWRMSKVQGFSDCVILGFNSHDEALLARPYAYASLAGTSCPSSLVGVEKISAMPVAQIVLHWENTGKRMVI